MATAKKETKQSTKTTKAKKETNESAVEKSKPVEKKMVARDIDLNQLIPVLNGFQGKLIYVSPRTNEKFEWDEFGDMQEIELRELKSAKSSAKEFFINNWFMFNDDYAWVVDYLGLRQYYKNAISVDDFDELFTKTPAEIESIISKLSKGQKSSVSYRARQLIIDGEIDSNKAIAALEKSLGVQLIER